ncbi:MAG: AGE family epimerase/isomerase [Sphaerochaetaceae bacterium]|nr:AGE family epimerase/isomerase [Sphaerochaetaceae bacterium]
MKKDFNEFLKKDWLEFFFDQFYFQDWEFWKNNFDLSYGGVFTCFDNLGENLKSLDKYVWSQGRMLYILSFALKNGYIKEEVEFYQNNTKKLYEFLEKNIFPYAKEGGVAFLLTQDGTVKEGFKSFYADCFIILGYCAYADLLESSNPSLSDYIYSQALSLYERTLSYITNCQKNKIVMKTEPYNLPAGYSTQAIYMILVNTSYELGRKFPSVKTDATKFAKLILNDFFDEKTMLLKEIIPNDGKNTILGNHKNPGHAIECMWFCYEALKESRNKKYFHKIAEIIFSEFDLGWDKENGGLLRYIYDKKVPSGQTGFDELIKNTWSYKLWWPQAEAINALILLSFEPEFSFCKMKARNYLSKIVEYTYKTFPLEKGKEWAQIRDIEGNPIEKVVALKVKDPYHILRMDLRAMSYFEKKKK